jgi:uncharacterized surface protein with fasciclin (FAS1) repeats
MPHKINTRGVLASALFATAVAAPPAAAQHKTIPEVAVEAGSFGTLVAALQAADLVDVLAGDGPFTVFAPTDDAFAKLPHGTVETLLEPENRERLTAILTYHVVPGRVSSAQAARLTGAGTVNGQRLAIERDHGALRIDDATVISADVGASNGVIHVIDSVLLPSDETLIEVARDAGSFGTLLAAVDAAGLTHDLMGDGPFTVFAPTDEAFGALPEGTVASLLEPENRDQLREILTYHVASGRLYGADLLKDGAVETLAGRSVTVQVSNGRIQANDARVVATDIDAANGVVHVIDAVLIPGMSMQSAAAAGQLIRRAINLGAPLYNAGEIEACADVYMVTAESLLRMGSRLSDDVRSPLQRALSRAEHESSADERAWIMRRGLDAAYDELDLGRLAASRSSRPARQMPVGT